MNRLVNTLVPRSDLLCVDHGQAAIDRRLVEMKSAPHVTRLNEWVESLRSGGALPAASAATIPWFDPRSAGVRARVLLLLQDPSAIASSTRFISPDNNDPTARCTTEACAAADIKREERLHWNVFPWWVNVPGSKSKERGPRDPNRPIETWPAARAIAAKLTGELFGTLPELRVVVVCGKQAQHGFADVRAAGLSLPAAVEKVDCPSLSPPGYHSHRLDAIDKLRYAARIAGL